MSLAAPAPVLVGLGGAVGAVARYGVGELLAHHTMADRFLAPTFAVNVLGTFVLGLLTFGGAGSEIVLLVGTGACGAFTTFSSFSMETVEVWARGERGLAASNAIGTLVGAGIALVVAWLLVA